MSYDDTMKFLILFTQEKSDGSVHLDPLDNKLGSSQKETCFFNINTVTEEIIVSTYDTGPEKDTDVTTRNTRNNVMSHAVENIKYLDSPAKELTVDEDVLIME